MSGKAASIAVSKNSLMLCSLTLMSRGRLPTYSLRALTLLASVAEAPPSSDATPWVAAAFALRPPPAAESAGAV